MLREGFGIAVALAAVGCGGGRVRTEQRVEVDVSAPPTAGGTVVQGPVYTVGVAMSGPPPDIVSQHMLARYQQFAPDMMAASPLHHGFLQTGQEERFETTLEAGRCYRVIGVGGPTMSDLDLFIVDENGNAIAQDTATDSFPVLGQGSDSICPRWTGPFFIRALAYSGYGEYGLQMFSTP